ncbi:hypothetical protein PoB_004225300 [Plakobranchus ocellatus]|uniref:Uncharacterized protein n=1 Tax=Plakobranchus ocellatus TaxID=259542 RepID=A0AAV4BAA6_9GAST|nr:hypothetical protein PoB_004225300 [Plakobranchus ocellatus]
MPENPPLSGCLSLQSVKAPETFKTSPLVYQYQSPSGPSSDPASHTLGRPKEKSRLLPFKNTKTEKYLKNKISVVGACDIADDMIRPHEGEKSYFFPTGEKT